MAWFHTGGNIDDDGAKALVEALEENKSVTALCLGGSFRPLASESGLFLYDVKYFLPKSLYLDQFEEEEDASSPPLFTLSLCFRFARQG